jgi:hypothetical protein
MKKTTIIKWVIGAAVLYAAYVFFFTGSDCEPQEAVKLMSDLQVFV